MRGSEIGFFFASQSSQFQQLLFQLRDRDWHPKFWFTFRKLNISCTFFAEKFPSKFPYVPFWNFWTLFHSIDSQEIKIKSDFHGGSCVSALESFQKNWLALESVVLKMALISFWLCWASLLERSFRITQSSNLLSWYPPLPSRKTLFGKETGLIRTTLIGR